MKTIRIDKQGAVSFVHDEQLAEGFSGEHRRQRASYVEPADPLVRFLFHVIRHRVSDDSFLAAWTRRWPCVWRARILKPGEPTLYETRDRQEAIDHEVRWLNSNWF